jgi:2-oxoisovalerate dehydrogenase E2 component (dihydrolipoyl transacylase)
MLQQITMPQLGESVTEGTIERWLVKEGDIVEKYAPLAEVLTDKVSAEIPSSFAGVIQQLIAQEGQTYAVGTIVCTIEVEEEQGNQLLPPTEQQQLVQADTTMKKMGARYSPAVVTLAAQNGVNLIDVTGTGAEGRITRKDVEAFIKQGSIHKEQPQLEKINEALNNAQQNAKENIEQTKQNDKRNEKTVLQNGDIQIPVTSLRRTIANNMVRSVQEIPHAWMTMEVDVTDLVAYRDEIKEAFLQKEGFNLTYFAFFVKAVALGLKQYPMLNSVWQDDVIIQKKDINISIAVAHEEALFVPVIKQVDDKSIKGIAKDIHQLSNAVRKGQLKSEHIQGGTFTVNNTGTFGSIQSMGIINYPQAAILQVEKIVKKPVIVQGDMLAIRQICHLCLSLDHRILDGVICGNFLSYVKNILENANKQTMSVY